MGHAVNLCLDSPLVAFQVSGCKFLHEPVDLLRLAWEPKALQEDPQCRNEIFALEVHLIHVGVHHLFVEAVVIPEKLSHLSLKEQRSGCLMLGGSTEYLMDFLVSLCLNCLGTEYKWVFPTKTSKFCTLMQQNCQPYSNSFCV